MSSPDTRHPERLADDNLAMLLERLYRHRFSEQDLQRLRQVWRILVRDFFQKRIRPEATVVDLGAGACFFINEVRAKRRIALDGNPDVLKRAGPGVEAMLMKDLSLREIPDAGAGHLFMSNFLEHLPDYVTALELLTAVHRKLEPGGSVMILQPNFRLAPTRYFDFVDHRLILTDRSLVEALEVVGFRIDELRIRFLPLTSKSRLPQWAWAVSLYLRIPPAQWLLGKQTYVAAVKAQGAGA